METTRGCDIDGCARGHYSRGWCSLHWQRWSRNGDPMVVGKRRPTAADRFWAKVAKDGPPPAFRPSLGPCWIWAAGRMKDGYGRLRIGPRRAVLAHRFAYEQLRGPIPESAELDHLCRVPSCVNPEHLEPVSHRENCRRGLRGILAKGHQS